jgi:hypothetical protein
MKTSRLQQDNYRLSAEYKSKFGIERPAHIILAEMDRSPALGSCDRLIHEMTRPHHVLAWPGMG